jgi:hypothetical protein
MADQMQSDKNRQDTGKPVQLDKEQQHGTQQQDKDKKPMGGQEQRPTHQGGAEHQGGSKR